MKKIVPFSLLTIVFTLTTCKNSILYQVDATLEPYLNLFLQEAEKRNLHFDVEEDGLLLQFADLDEPTIGLCTYSDPLLVQIDLEYWNEVKQYDNCEDLRQNVVFHELAHGLLNRMHDNKTLENAEWGSLMCGGEEVDSRSWQVNFSGERREYYLNELFKPSTAHPQWGKYGEKFSGEKGNLIKKLNLSNDKYEVDEEGNVFQIKNGIYNISLNSNNNTILPMWTDQKLDGDFYYEIALKGDLSENSKCMGISVGYPLDNDVVYTSLLVYHNYIYKNFRASAVNSNCLSPLAEVVLKDEVMVRDDFNSFAVERKSDRLRFYINQQLVYTLDRDADKQFSTIAFVIPGASTYSIQNAGVYGNGSSLKSGTTEEICTFPSLKNAPKVDVPSVHYNR